MAENFRVIEGGVTSPKGFKANGHKDRKYGVALIVSEVDAVCAGVFTTNKVFAHPVALSKEVLKSSSTFRAIVANSGNANCFTKGGMDDALAMVKKASDLLNIPENQILSASTGVIGRNVITSYSIHYTKLYEFTGAFFQKKEGATTLEKQFK